MKKLKLTPSTYNRGEVLTKAQLKKVMGGGGSGTPCIIDFDCGVAGRCINFMCNNSYGTGSDCQVNNGGCDIGRICVYSGGGGPVKCI